MTDKKEIKKEIKKKTKKLQTMILSVFLSVIVWFMVIYVNDPDITTKLSDLDIRFSGEAELRSNGLVITEKDDIPSVSVVVTGKRSDLTDFMDDIYVVVDMTDISEEGDYNLPCSLYMPTTRINPEETSEDTIPVKVERITDKEIPVVIKQTGTLKDKIVQSVPKSSTVKIRGASSEVDKVDHAEATIDISSITGDGNVKVGYVLTDFSNSLIQKNETIESLVPDIDVYNTVYNLKTLSIEPVLTGSAADEYILNSSGTSVIPSQIQVGVEDGSNTDKLIVYIDTVYDEGFGDYTVTAPADVYIPEENKTVRVRTNTSKKYVKELEFEVEAINVPENLQVTMNNKITASVWSDNENFSASDIHATVDLNGLNAGSYELPVKINGQNIGLQSECTIYVTIQ